MHSPACQVNYVHADHQGSTVARTDIYGTVTKGYLYNSFGVPANQGFDPYHYTYTGREWDNIFKVFYYRARYYDPEAGRFLSTDPIGFAGGDMNLFAYVGNNAVNLTDPMGLDVWSGAGVSVGGFLGIFGTATTEAWLTNWQTGEKCFIEMRHFRIGIGLGGGATALSLWLPNGPSCGKDLNGLSVGFGIEGGLGGYASGAPGGGIGVTSKRDAAVTFGCGYGAGFAEYADIASLKVIFCECR